MSLEENKKLLHKKKQEIETKILLSEQNKNIINTNKSLNEKEKIKNKFILDRLLKNLDTITKTANTS